MLGQKLPDTTFLTMLLRTGTINAAIRDSRPASVKIPKLNVPANILFSETAAMLLTT